MDVSERLQELEQKVKEQEELLSCIEKRFSDFVVDAVVEYGDIKNPSRLNFKKKT